MWDLPRPGLEPVSPGLAGGFLTTAPPGKSGRNYFNDTGERSQKNLVLFLNLLLYRNSLWIHEQLWHFHPGCFPKLYTVPLAHLLANAGKRYGHRATPPPNKWKSLEGFFFLSPHVTWKFGSVLKKGTTHKKFGFVQVRKIVFSLTHIAWPKGSK